VYCNPVLRKKPRKHKRALSRRAFLAQNNLAPAKLEHFQTAAGLLRERYAGLIETRFHSGKNVTVVHGDLHPGSTFLSRSDGKVVKFIDLQAVRLGLCAEDLAMLLALHIEPDKSRALPLLEHYHRCLCESVGDYSFETFIGDYQIAVMENMFFTLRLINRGIFDFPMRDRAIKAFETFVLNF